MFMTGSTATPVWNANLANNASTEMADIFDSGLSALKLITKVYEIKIDNGTFISHLR